MSESCIKPHNLCTFQYKPSISANITVRPVLSLLNFVKVTPKSVGTVQTSLKVLLIFSMFVCNKEEEGKKQKGFFCVLKVN
jgi:hypothetical protein